MAVTPFIWLGAKRTRKHPVSDKGKLLDIAASRGLPVPNGGILLHELYQLLLTEGVIVLHEQRVTVADPTWLHETLHTGARFPRLGKPVAVRAAFAPGSEHVPARLDVDFDNPQALSNSLCAIWSAAAPAARRDVLVMEMVTRQVAGTAVTDPTQPHDAIHSEHTFTIPQLTGWQRPTASLPSYAQRLQQLLRGVRRTFGPTAPWRIEWVDDGAICWLVQIQ